MGTVLTPFLWPAVRGVVAAAPREGARLTTDLHLPLWGVVTAITLCWLLASMVARRVEHGASTAWWQPTRLETAALALSIAVVAIDRSPSLTPQQAGDLARTIAREGDHVDALELATWMRERRAGLRVLDVREGVDSTTYTIPGAEVLPLDRLTELTARPGEHLVLYSDGGAHAAQAWVILRARGFRDVKVLKDGLAAWEDEVVYPPPPRVTDDTATVRFERARALALWFGGHPRIVASPNETSASTATPASSAPRPRRRRTC